MHNLQSWTVYEKPLDHPSGFIARLFELDVPTDKVLTSPTLEELRKQIIKEGTALCSGDALVRIERSEHDHSSVVEVWV